MMMTFPRDEVKYISQALFPQDWIASCAFKQPEERDKAIKEVLEAQGFKCDELTGGFTDTRAIAIASYTKRRMVWKRSNTSMGNKRADEVQEVIKRVKHETEEGISRPIGSSYGDAPRPEAMAAPRPEAMAPPRPEFKLTSSPIRDDEIILVEGFLGNEKLFQFELRSGRAVRDVVLNQVAYRFDPPFHDTGQHSSGVILLETHAIKFLTQDNGLRFHLNDSAKKSQLSYHKGRPCPWIGYSTHTKTSKIDDEIAAMWNMARRRLAPAVYGVHDFKGTLMCYYYSTLNILHRNAHHSHGTHE
jgi:hypothetical protein